jgi:GntR family transcriptional regulator / MocR family aminotransferase
VHIPLQIVRDGPETLQNQIFGQIRDFVLSGRLKPGTAMPGSRVLAEELGVSRNTVLLAYERLITEGYLQTLPATGTFVSNDLPDASIVYNPRSELRHPPHESTSRRRPVIFEGRAQRRVSQNRDTVSIDFWGSRPNPSCFPLNAWRRSLLRKLAHAGTSLTEYGDPAGMYELRRAIADFVGPARGFRLEPEQIVIVHGIQEALNIIARLFIEQGTLAATENPCSQGAAYTFESYGAELIPVPVDDDGIDVALLPDQPISLLYLTPSHQFPTGRTLSLERRFRVLEWAWRVGAYIIEDDYDSDFRYDGPPLSALAGLDRHDSVIYLGTFSKSIGPGLRIGYMVLPPDLVEPAVTIKALLDSGHSWLDQAVLAEFIASGDYIRHLRRIRLVYKSRRDRLLEVLRREFGDVTVSGRRGGMHIMWRLPDDFPTAAKLETMARESGVGIYSLGSGGVHDYDCSPYSERSILLGYSSVPEDRIDEGIRRIAERLARSGRAARTSRATA